MMQKFIYAIILVLSAWSGIYAQDGGNCKCSRVNTEGSANGTTYILHINEKETKNDLSDLKTITPVKRIEPFRVDQAMSFEEYKKYTQKTKEYEKDNILHISEKEIKNDLSYLKTLTPEKRSELLKQRENRKNLLEYLAKLNPSENAPIFKLSAAKQNTKLNEYFANWTGISFYKKGYKIEFKTLEEAQQFLEKVKIQGFFAAIDPSSQNIQKFSLKRISGAPRTVYPKNTIENKIDFENINNYKVKQFIVKQGHSFWVVDMQESKINPL